MSGQSLHQLHVGSSMPKDWGGIERYIVYVTTEMVNRGHQVTVTAPKNSPLSKKLTAPQIPARLLHKYDPIILAKYLRILKAQQPDILITHFSPDYIMPAYAARLTQTRTCMTRHVTAHFKPSRTKLYEKLYDGYIAISRAVENHLIEDNIPKQKVHLAYNGSPPLIPTGTIPLDSPSVAVFGRLVWVKGQDVAIRALEHLPNVHLHLFGDGPFRGELQLLSQAIGVGDRTHFHGHINDVANAMQSADIILIPSIWREAFGFTAVEAPTTKLLSSSLPQTLNNPTPKRSPNSSNRFSIIHKKRKNLEGPLKPTMKPISLSNSWPTVSKTPTPKSRVFERYQRYPQTSWSEILQKKETLNTPENRPSSLWGSVIQLSYERERQSSRSSALACNRECNRGKKRDDRKRRVQVLYRSRKAICLRSDRCSHQENN
jgi:hypothetical protein